MSGLGKDTTQPTTLSDTTGWETLNLEARLVGLALRTELDASACGPAALPVQPVQVAEVVSLSRASFKFQQISNSLGARVLRLACTWVRRAWVRGWMGGGFLMY